MLKKLFLVGLLLSTRCVFCSTPEDNAMLYIRENIAKAKQTQEKHTWWAWAGDKGNQLGGYGRKKDNVQQVQQFVKQNVSQESAGAPVGVTGLLKSAFAATSQSLASTACNAIRETSNWARGGTTVPQSLLLDFIVANHLDDQPEKAVPLIMSTFLALSKQENSCISMQDISTFVNDTIRRAKERTRISPKFASLSDSDSLYFQLKGIVRFCVFYLLNSNHPKGAELVKLSNESVQQYLAHTYELIVSLNILDASNFDQIINTLYGAHQTHLSHQFTQMPVVNNVTNSATTTTTTTPTATFPTSAATTPTLSSHDKLKNILISFVDSYYNLARVELFHRMPLNSNLSLPNNEPQQNPPPPITHTSSTTVSNPELQTSQLPPPPEAPDDIAPEPPLDMSQLPPPPPPPTTTQNNS